MSRWKETLCGSVILKNAEATPEIFRGQQSEMLSCGGKFFTRSDRFQVMNQKPDLINLPTFNQTMVRESDGRMVRYGDGSEGRIKEDMDQVARELNRGDIKTIK